jgi:hypothetical protein
VESSATCPCSTSLASPKRAWTSANDTPGRSRSNRRRNHAAARRRLSARTIPQRLAQSQQRAPRLPFRGTRHTNFAWLRNRGFRGGNPSAKALARNVRTFAVDLWRRRRPPTSRIAQHGEAGPTKPSRLEEGSAKLRGGFLLCPSSARTLKTVVEGDLLFQFQVLKSAASARDH